MPPFDFKKLARGGAISSITDPAALFDALPNKAEGYGYLRAVQKTILDAWSPRRNERDLVIKTNTGGGKAIAGLLILQASIHEASPPRSTSPQTRTWPSRCARRAPSSASPRSTTLRAPSS